jgi:hypothetical protein
VFRFELKTLLTERWGFSFNLLNESQEEVVEEAEEAEETLNEEEEELEEGGAALRVGNEDRLQQRHAHPDRIHEDKESLDEAKIRQLVRKLVMEAAKRGKK